MAAIFIQQQDHLPPPIMRMDRMQEQTEVFGPLSSPDPKQPVTSPRVKGAKDHPPRVGTAERHGSVLSPLGPTGPQGRKQEQISFVFKQYDAARPQLGEPPPDAAFFSRARDRAPIHSGAASIHIPVATIAASGWSRTAAGHRCPPSARVTEARSSWRLGSPSDREAALNSPLAQLAAAQSRSRGVRPPCDRVAPPDRSFAGSAPTNCRASAGSRLSSGQYGQRVSPAPSPAGLGCADISVLRERCGVACPSDGADQPSVVACSWSTSGRRVPRANPSVKFILTTYLGCFAPLINVQSGILDIIRNKLQWVGA